MNPSSEQEAFRTSVSRFLRAKFSPHLDDWENTGLPHRHVLTTLASRGYLGIEQDRAVGGLGLNSAYTLIFARALGQLSSGSLAMSVSVQSDIVLPLLADYGTQLVRKEFLEPGIRGEKTSAFAVSEVDGGASLENVRTVAEPKGDNLVINGAKTWITNGSAADFILAAVRAPGSVNAGGLSLVVVPTHLPGVAQRTISGKLGNRASDHGHIDFVDVVVPRSNVLGGVGEGYLQLVQALARERRFIAVVACAQAHRILDDATGWARTHRVRGGPLIDAFGIRQAIVDVSTQLELVDAYVDQWSDPLRRPESELRTASVMKLKATEIARRAAELNMQLHGARAYMSPDGPARDVRDCAAWSLAGGADMALTQFISEHIDAPRAASSPRLADCERTAAHVTSTP